MLPPPPGFAVSNQATARHAVVGSRECSPRRPACNSITSSRHQEARTEDMHAVVGSERAYTAHADDDDHTGRGQLRSGVMVCVRRGIVVCGWVRLVIGVSASRGTISYSHK
eukprot:scaffold9899_cov60-Cyclotella_meneghiniana.AAC.1